ncbi:hypothetical protein [Klebsiella quasipneumoniae]|uniref:hypothetical protein n=1 Tax=Klebsiella quasipneumoniae TaxID=1463165 RepID=UPI0038906753
MSEFSRETLLNIIETDHVQCGEASALARMALAAMDSSESVELPLDYLQGHKDGLEWAAQLAEANHPETGDWLYDDPIELAKAIRKGPDMPPAQPVADSEPDRNPVLAYADSYRDMAKQGVESVPIWSVITDIERNIAPLYRHAQPVLVIPDEMTAEQAYEIGYYYGDPVNVFARGANWMRQHIIDSTLAAAQHDTPALNSLQSVDSVADRWIPVSEQKPDCWCLTCRPLTLNDMRFVVCPDCGNKRCPRANDHRNACTGSNEPGQEGSAYPAAPQEVPDGK